MEPTVSSPSPSPDALIGVDPDDTVEVSYGGATFTVGTVPADVWAKLNAELMLARQEAIRRTIPRLAASGTDPNAVVQSVTIGTEEVSLTELDVNTSLDVVFTTESMRVYAEAASYALRGHTGFVNRKGEPFPFARVGDRMDARTERVYRANGKLLQALWLHIRRLNDLGLTGKKA